MVFTAKPYGLDVRARLAVDRLLYAQKVFAVGPAFLQRIIHLEAQTVKDSWLVGLKADLQWMHDVNPTALPSGWLQDMTPLFDNWQSRNFPWKAMVKAVARKQRMQEQMMAEVISLHKGILRCCVQGGHMSPRSLQ